MVVSDGDATDERTDEVTITVTVAANDAPTGVPVIGGTATVGGTLTADAGAVADADGLSDPCWKYQWQVSDDGTSGWTDIATGQACGMEAGNEGKYFRVAVTFTDDGGATETLVSAAVPYVNDAPRLTAQSLQVDSLGTRVFTEANPHASDAEDSDEHIIFTLTGLPGLGTLQLRGDWDNDGNTAETWRDLVLNGSFTQQDVADGDLQYVNTSGASGDTDSFVFSLNDDAENPDGNDITGIFNITITDIIWILSGIR